MERSVAGPDLLPTCLTAGHRFVFLVTHVDETEAPGDRRAAVVRHVATDLDVGDPVEIERGRRQRPGRGSHRPSTNGVGAQPVADLDRVGIPAAVQTAASEQTLARRRPEPAP